jgi:quinol monooxygenase YgiN
VYVVQKLPWPIRFHQRRLTTSADIRYEDVEANTQTHRASAEYKTFRAAVGAEELLEFPSDLRFWRPFMGFMKREGKDPEADQFFSHKQPLSAETCQYIVVDELLPKPRYKDSLLKSLSELVQRAEQNQNILSFWVLNREDKDEDPGLLVFARYVNRRAWIEFEESEEISAAWKEANYSCQWPRRTIWVDSGIGFLGR